MKIISFTIVNSENKKYNFPIEDFYLIDEKNKIFVVADGVSRDPLEDLSKYNYYESLKIFSKKYPRPSPSRDVAEIFCKNFLLSIKREKSVKKSFGECNKKIQKYNKKKFEKVDYLVNDFASCVASGIRLKNNYFEYGFICDCGIAIFDKDGKLKFRTENQGPNKIHKNVYKDKRLENFSDSKTRKIIRKEYRNNPKQKWAYGALTGEANAMHYVQMGKQKFEKGDFILIYSDGLELAIFSKGFSNLLNQKKFSEIKKLFQKEVEHLGTLILLAV